MFDQPHGDSLSLLRTATGRQSGRSVLDLLLDLLKGLAALGESEPAGRTKPAMRRYRDAEFHYIEAAMPGLEGVEADICIHNGRIFVRVAR